MSLKEDLSNIDNGRFRKLIEAMDVKDVCYNCRSFNPKVMTAYVCAISGYCIGHTLSEDLLAYLLKQVKEPHE
jgi:hypothetical protein